MSIWTQLYDAVSRVGASIETLLQTRDEARPMDGGLSFTIAMVALTAKMAFADGQVTQDEVATLHRLFEVPERERKNVERFFDLARTSMDGFEAHAGAVARMFRDRPGVLEDVLDALFIMALADGAIHPRELDYLALAADIFGFSDAEFDRIRANHIEDCDPYCVLGLAADCGEEELRRKYLLLVRENHPDALMGRGVPSEFVALANTKLAAINRAYDEIRRRRTA
jgi:DnaJ like chaperone protein